MDRPLVAAVRAEREIAIQELLLEAHIVVVGTLSRWLAVLDFEPGGSSADCFRALRRALCGHGRVQRIQHP